MLTVEQGNIWQPLTTYERQSWEKLIIQTKPECRPRVVIKIWPSNAQLWSKGRACKSTTSRWQTLDYVSQYKRVSATNAGGAIVQARLVVARVRYE
jgi:hypothetical protein